MEQNKRLESVLTAAGLSVALLLTVICSQGDLWLDEIWSLRFAEQASTFRAVFTDFRHDNNHLLNTLYLYLVEPQSLFYRYRLLSVLSGAGALYIMSRLARPQGIWAVAGILLLGGTSYPLILYFSEARGYAPAIFCSLLAYWLLQKNRHNPAWPELLLFHTAMLIGILAHFSFIITMISLCCLTAVQSRHTAAAPFCRLRLLARLYLLPLTFFAALYLMFIRGMAIGGGNEVDHFGTVSYASALLLGMPDTRFFHFAAPACYAVVLSAGVFILTREQDDDWVLYLAVLLLAPALVLLMTRPPVLYFRYFAVCFPFFYLLLVKVLSAVFRAESRLSRLLVCALMCAMVAGQAVRLAALVSSGRGSYREALAYISEHTPGTVLRVGSDHDFRNGLVLSFYARFLPAQKQLEYIEQSSWNSTSPEWLFSHSQTKALQPAVVVSFDGVGSFQLQRRFRSNMDSGWEWNLYRRTASSPEGGPAL